MQEIFILSHASDIDGVGAAALIKIKFEVPSSNLFFTEYSKEAIDYVHKNLSMHYRDGIILFLTDLGIDEHLIGDYLRIINGVKMNGGKVLWFDHHPWSKRAIKELASRCDTAIVGENERYCGTEITYAELGFTDRFTRDFKELVHYSDFNLKPKTGEQKRIIGTYTLSITSYAPIKSRDTKMRKLRHIADVISKGRFLDSIIVKDAKRFNKINMDRTRLMLKGLIIRDQFAVGFSKGVQSTSGCIAVREKAKRQIGIYINTTDWKGHIRCETKDISILANKLGGGGHPHASGFFIEPKGFGYMKSRYQREKFADFLEKKIAQFVK